jgi:YHS domain-containing protein
MEYLLIISSLLAGVVEVGNERCPVSGRPVVAEHTYVYKGKKYNLCSHECSAPFADNPEEYAEIAENEEVEE